MYSEDSGSVCLRNICGLPDYTVSCPRSIQPGNLLPWEPPGLLYKWFILSVTRSDSDVSSSNGNAQTVTVI